ncbi:oxidoreductase family protein [Cladochytrium replicatum]|nr:oxidoreductase family protein [Cladochytrium replicatum]
MAPIRVALIGLSASAKVTWAADAHLPYLLSEIGRKHYELTALLNSSVEAAESAKATFNLPNLKAYGDPESLAADPDIDLVVVNTRVDIHYSVVEPSLRAGKAIFVEWPLTEDLASAIRLTNGRPVPDSIVGLQGRVAPLFLRIKDILVAGTIGKVFNSEITAYGNLLERERLPESLEYFAERKVGGNPINIHYGHMIDYVHEVLGDWESFNARGQIQRHSLGVVGSEKHIKSDVPDYVSVHGTLHDKGLTVPGALLTATFRLGQPFKDDHGFRWTMNGEKGELRITAPGPFLMSGDSYYGPVTIEHYDHASNEVKKLEWDWPDWQKALPIRARATAELYERYAEWVESGRPSAVRQEREWPRLEAGVRLMKEFDDMFAQIYKDHRLNV